MKGRSIIAKAVVLAVVGVMFTGTVAFAHVYRDHTSLSLSARPHGQLQSGTTVRFRGTLNATHRKCYKHQMVLLIDASNGAVVASKRTNARGGYKIRFAVDATGSFMTRYNGRVFGTHPHSHTCLGSTSGAASIKIGNS